MSLPSPAICLSQDIFNTKVACFFEYLDFIRKKSVLFCVYIRLNLYRYFNSFVTTIIGCSGSSIIITQLTAKRGNDWSVASVVRPGLTGQGWRLCRRSVMFLTRLFCQSLSHSVCVRNYWKSNQPISLKLGVVVGLSYQSEAD